MKMPHVQSWATTHPGTRRKNNQDSFVNRPDLGLWAVADGAGGHRARLVRVCAQETELARCDFIWLLDRAYTVRIEATGTRIVAFVDGTRILEAEEPNFSGGGIGIIAEAASVGTDAVMVQSL